MALLRKTFRKNYTGQEFRVGENYHRREENRMTVGLFMSACKFCKQLSSKQINRVDNAFQTRESRCPPFISSFQPFHDHFSFLFFLSDMHAVWLSLQPCLIWVWLHLKFKKLCSLFFPLLFTITFLFFFFPHRHTVWQPPYICTLWWEIEFLSTPHKTDMIYK